MWRLNPKPRLLAPRPRILPPPPLPPTPHWARNENSYASDLLVVANLAPGAAGAPLPLVRPGLRPITSRIDAYKQRLAVISGLEASVAKGIRLDVTREQLRYSRWFVESIIEQLEPVRRQLSDVLDKQFPSYTPEVEIPQQQKDEENENKGAAVRNAKVDSENNLVLDETHQEVTASEVGGGNNKSEDPSSSGSSGLEIPFSAVVNRKKDSYTLNKFRQFLERFRVEGDASYYYVCQAIGIASCGSCSMHVRYSHLATCHDKDWVRELVNNKDRLAAQLATTALEFVRYVAAKVKIQREILELKVEYIQMPRRYEAHT
ncbi:uncharacterized protein [Aegilops tauschii subsp. strangulata]|uniref:uncharacterized protein n=1 Tax=Aegilops tauschii subsp. strangulata TaxID=200361 RepID=UPI001E1CAB23|nr:uncharacterized protein LOC120976549 [Aegilops tauschii subsp. strangulata]